MKENDAVLQEPLSYSLNSSTHFRKRSLRHELKRHQSARELVWVQEEPSTMASLSYILPLIEELAGNLPIRSIKRSASASPATGSAEAHELEQKALLSLALGGHENA